MSGDGGYDTLDCYDAITARGAASTIPPRRNAKIQQHGNRQAPANPRFGKFATDSASRAQAVETGEWLSSAFIVRNYDVPPQIYLWRAVAAARI